MKTSSRQFIILAALAASFALPAGSRASDYAIGADLSFLKQVEDRGTKFKDARVEKPGLQIFRDHGYNWIRLRVCVEPVGHGLPNGLAYTLSTAKAARELGFKFLLDFHYSNAWADPTNEPTPEAWQGLGPEPLVDAVFTYTRDTIAALREAGVLPDMVQVGNEVANGMLWPVGKLPENWDNFAALIYAGINGVDAGRGNLRRPKILLHIDNGGDVFLARRFFDHLNTYGIPYDAIGVSFYPWSHGTLADLRANLTFLAEEYGRDVYVVETGYYWKPSRYFANTPPPLPETPDGQRGWLEAVNAVVMSTPHNHGKGVFWWEPAAAGGLVGRGFFDEEHNALPVFHAFDPFTRPPHRTDGQEPTGAPPAALRFGAAP